MNNLINSNEWVQLEKHKDVIEDLNMRQLFQDDPKRFDKYSIEFNDILFDYSKNLFTDGTLPLLLDLAWASGLKQSIYDMFSGVKINFTENRAVLHTALRNKGDRTVLVDNNDVMPGIRDVLKKMKTFSDKIHSGKWQSAKGKKITTIVNIGIGGSDLGPRMVVEALKDFQVEGIKSYFVSNVDPRDINHILKEIKIEESLFIIASKTFTTQETMTNAAKARDAFLNAGFSEDDIAKHFVALSTNKEGCKEFGIPEDNMFEFWDWVGGRYSLWSAIGLSISLAIGFDNFDELLLGAYEMDEHFRTSDFKNNIPVIMALLGIWYNNFHNCASQAIIPYNQYLLKFSDFLQQLDMESNGKYIDCDSKQINYKTGAVVWGTIGTNSQHSFFQLIHQGTQIIPADFIATCKSPENSQKQNDILLSNFFAQTEALMLGKTQEEVLEELENQGKSKEEIEMLLPHKVFPGNRPTTIILIKELNPKTLGSLIAMYEHKVFVQGVIWKINSFDQWGVELGKVLAKKIQKEMNEGLNYKHDNSTNQLLKYYMQNR